MHGDALDQLGAPGGTRTPNLLIRRLVIGVPVLPAAGNAGIGRVCAGLVVDWRLVLNDRLIVRPSTVDSRTPATPPIAAVRRRSGVGAGGDRRGGGPGVGTGRRAGTVVSLARSPRRSSRGRRSADASSPSRPSRPRIRFPAPSIPDAADQCPSGLHPEAVRSVESARAGEGQVQRMVIRRRSATGERRPQADAGVGDGDGDGDGEPDEPRVLIRLGRPTA